MRKATLRYPTQPELCRIVAVKALTLTSDLEIERAKKVSLRHACRVPVLNLFGTQRLLREVIIWAGLNHPNVLPFWGYHFSGEQVEAWLVCPWMEYGNVKQYLARKPMDGVEVCRLVSTTAAHSMVDRLIREQSMRFWTQRRDWSPCTPAILQ